MYVIDIRNTCTFNIINNINNVSFVGISLTTIDNGGKVQLWPWTDYNFINRKPSTFQQLLQSIIEYFSTWSHSWYFYTCSWSRHFILHICSIFIWLPWHTWGLLPHMAFIWSDRTTADRGSSMDTFLVWIELRTLAVIWSVPRKADLSSFMVTFPTQYTQSP